MRNKIFFSRWGAIACVAALFLPLGSAFPVDHQPSTPPLSEYEVKAAFLYNFAKFVEWPPDALVKKSGVFVIGILGQDPFGQNLDSTLEGKTIQDNPLVIKRVSTVHEATGCQVLFISASDADHVETILAQVKDLPVLTVSDMDRFVQRGGMVGMSIEEKRVKFSINMAAAEKADLKVSSQLLKLAQRVITLRLAATQYAWFPFATILSARS